MVASYLGRARHEEGGGADHWPEARTWLALVLGVYIIAAIDLKPVWSSVLHDTFFPSGLRSREAWSTVVAILGTTISPYLFFWQASQEVEEESLSCQR